MSYLISATIILVAILSFIALFGEARETIKGGQRRARKAEKARLIAVAIEGTVHKMNPASFEKLVVHVYEELGYRVKVLAVSKEQAMLLEQNEVYTLMVYKNHTWPMGQETLETFYYHKKKMGLEAMTVIATGGFNESALEWSKGQHEVKFINEENFIELCNEVSTTTPYLIKGGEFIGNIDN